MPCSVLCRWDLSPAALTPYLVIFWLHCAGSVVSGTLSLCWPLPSWSMWAHRHTKEYFWSGIWFFLDNNLAEPAPGPTGENEDLCQRGGQRHREDQLIFQKNTTWCHEQGAGSFPDATDAPGATNTENCGGRLLSMGEEPAVLWQESFWGAGFCSLPFPPCVAMFRSWARGCLPSDTSGSQEQP